MSQMAKVMVGAVTDFILTAGVAIVALKGAPDSWGWVVIGVGGSMAAAKHVRGMLLQPEKL